MSARTKSPSPPSIAEQLVSRGVRAMNAGDYAIPASAIAWLTRVESVHASSRRTTIRVRTGSGVRRRSR